MFKGEVRKKGSVVFISTNYNFKINPTEGEVIDSPRLPVNESKEPGMYLENAIGDLQFEPFHSSFKLKDGRLTAVLFERPPLKVKIKKGGITKITPLSPK